MRRRGDIYQTTGVHGPGFFCRSSCEIDEDLVRIQVTIFQGEEIDKFIEGISDT